MNAETPIQVTVDPARNLLRMAFAGAVAAGDLAKNEQKIATALMSLAPGFSLLTDLTELQSMERGCIPGIEKMMDAFRGHGVKLIVRVIPDSTKDIGMNIMSLFHYPRGVKIITTTTRDDGERLLR